MALGIQVTAVNIVPMSPPFSPLGSQPCALHCKRARGSSRWGLQTCTGTCLSQGGQEVQGSMHSEQTLRNPPCVSSSTSCVY